MTTTPPLAPPLAIGVAPNGARRTKADHPTLPITADEIGEEAARCADAGAAFIHLHVRDGRGAHILEPEAYREAIAAIRTRRGPDELAIQITTEAAGIYGRARQIALVRELVPDAASVAVRELFPDFAAGSEAADSGSEAAPSESEAADFAAWMHRRGVAVQYILYAPSEVRAFEDLLARGAVPAEGFWVLFVLGRYGGAEAEPADLLPFLQAMRSDYPWAACAFGRREIACAVTAAGLGGHPRVGFENNLHLPSGELARTSADLVAEVAAASRHLGRPLARATALPRL